MKQNIMGKPESVVGSSIMEDSSDLEDEGRDGGQSSID
jgi:hypothetical protein